MAKLSDVFLNLLGKTYDMTPFGMMSENKRRASEESNQQQQQLDNQRLSSLASFGNVYDTGETPMDVPGMGKTILQEKMQYDQVPEYLPNPKTGKMEFTGKYQQLERPRGGHTTAYRPPSAGVGRPTLREVPGTGRLEWFDPANAGSGGGGPAAQGLSKAQNVVDTEFAKDYNDFVAQGGQSDPVKLVSGIDEAISSLGKTNKATGRVMGLLGRQGRAFVNSESGVIEDKVRDAVQRNLRLILGGQFAEKEGENLVRTAYNPTLPEAEVAKRLKSLSTQMKLALKSKQDAAKYYEANGSLAGFKGKQYSMADFQVAVGGQNEVRDSLATPSSGVSEREKFIQGAVGKGYSRLEAEGLASQNGLQ